MADGNKSIQAAQSEFSSGSVRFGGAMGVLCVAIWSDNCEVVWPHGAPLEQCDSRVHSMQIERRTESRRMGS